MNKYLLQFGGAFNLLFVLFQLSLLKPIAAVVSPLSPDIGATVSTFNIQVTFALLAFAYLDIFRWRDLLKTRLGNIVAILIALFWFLRGAAQIGFYGATTADMPMLLLCLAFGLLHLVPALREWKSAQHAPAEAVEAASGSNEQSRGLPWASYAVIVWCVVFGGLHLYWALGGNAGFVEFSTPTSKEFALTRASGYMTMTWAVVFVCLYGIIIALVPFLKWTRRFPRWLLLAPLWIACGIALLRGFGNPIQSALILGGGMAFETASAAEALAWDQWLLLDALLFSPWFILGGLAFGATAWFVARQGKSAGRGMALQEGFSR